jgi:hypothetical protein
MHPCPTDRHHRRGVLRGVSLLLAAGVVAAVCGCGSDKLPVAPAKGKVTYNGKELEFGSVIFQPEKGPPARGQIQSDGTFVLGTYGTNDGAIIGKCKIRVTCTENQRPGYTPPQGEEAGVGKSLIPKKYTRAQTSGLTEEVKAGGPNDFTIELKD